MSENKRKKAGDPMAKAMDLTIWQSAKTDPQGSYPGTPADPSVVPVPDGDYLLRCRRGARPRSPLLRTSVLPAA